MTGPALQSLLVDIAGEIAAMPERGTPAQYIPELACIDADQFAMAICEADGSEASVGDSDTLFSIQSISKVFTLTLAMERLGADLFQRVGREPSGDPFNSIIQLEAERGKPRNPFINAGAIVLADVVLAGRTPQTALGDVLSFVRDRSEAPEIDVDPAVARSEAETGFRNRALANFMKAEGNIRHEVDDVLALYFQHCAIAMSVRQLARTGRYLAFGGLGVAPPATLAQINALMLTCGHYDGSGAFAFRVGLPGKSGVGGGILAILPGRASIAAWCPGLGPKGNSALATLALERLAARTGWSVFAPTGA